MKQLIFLILLTLIGTIGAFSISPFWGVAVYYFFAVLRPQYIWQWALISYDADKIRWSYYVAIATILAALAHKFGFVAVSEPGNSAGQSLTIDAAAQDRRSGKSFTSAHILILAFGLWIGVSYLGARDRGIAGPWFWEYAKIFIMFLVATLLIRSIRHVWTLFVLGSVALGYLAYEINATYLSLDHPRITIYDDGYGGLDNNGAGLMLAMGVPMCLFVWEGVERWWRWAFAAMIPVLIHSVLLSFSRGAMLALLVGCPLFYLRSKHKKQLLICGLILFLALLPRMAGKEVRDRFFSIEQYEKDESVQGRFSSWKVAWEIAKDYPIDGIGLRNASAYADQYIPEAKDRTIHSQYLQILADTGFVGLALYLSALFLVWRNTRRAQLVSRDWTGQDQRHAYAAACGVECAMFVFCVGASFLSLEVFELPYLLLLLGCQLPLFLPSLLDRPAEQNAGTQEGSHLVELTA
jgi:probable O-glycosylation ligase (exosortase A-associated)